MWGWAQVLKSSILSFFGRGAAVAAAAPPLDIEDSRRFARISTSLAAVQHVNGDSIPVTIGNLSPAGAMVEVARHLSAGDGVHLVRGGLYVPGTVIWGSNGRSGIEFGHHIDLYEWLAPASNAGQSRVDEIVALVKAGIPTELRESNSARSAHFARLEDDLQLVGDLLQNLNEDLWLSQDTLRSHDEMFPLLVLAMEKLLNPELLRFARPQLAEELGAIFQLLVDLEDEVSGTRDTVAKHGYKLQNLDLAMQILTELASELIIGEGNKLLANPRLENLRAVCCKALQTPEKG
jgi:hypothetical protein